MWTIACSGDPEDSASPQDSDDVSPPEDTGPAPLSDCSDLHWRSDPDLLLTNQNEVDEFCFEWNALDGNLTIDLDGDPDDPIWELDGISCLCEVTGDLEIFWVADYDPDSSVPPPHSSTDLELGLLERVGGDLTVHDIWGLAQLSFMSALTEVGGDMTLYGLDNLTGIELVGLETIGGSFRLSDAAMLQAIAFESLVHLGGLELLAEAPGELAGLRKVTLSSIETLNGDLVMDGAAGLYSLEANSLTTIDGALRVQGGCSFVPELSLLSDVGSLELVGNCGLESLDGLPITAIRDQSEEGVSVLIRDNDGLDQDTLDAYIAGVEVTGEGSLEITAADDGACSAYQQQRWKADSDWCSE